MEKLTLTIEQGDGGVLIERKQGKSIEHAFALTSPLQVVEEVARILGIEASIYIGEDGVRSCPEDEQEGPYRWGLSEWPKPWPSRLRRCVVRVEKVGGETSLVLTGPLAEKLKDVGGTVTAGTWENPAILKLVLNEGDGIALDLFDDREVGQVVSTGNVPEHWLRGSGSAEEPRGVVRSAPEDEQGENVTIGQVSPRSVHLEDGTYVSSFLIPEVDEEHLKDFVFVPEMREDSGHLVAFRAYPAKDVRFRNEPEDDIEWEKSSLRIACARKDSGTHVYVTAGGPLRDELARIGGQRMGCVQTLELVEGDEIGFDATTLSKKVRRGVS